jgi:hypothetical protein
LGWIVAGTQYKDHTPEQALGGHLEGNLGHAILKVRPVDDAISNVAGDELRKGPLFNYARLFTWIRLSGRLLATMRPTQAASPPNDDIYGGFDETDPTVWRHMFVGSAAAILIQ